MGNFMVSYHVSMCNTHDTWILVIKEYKNMVIAFGAFNETLHLKREKFNNTKTIRARSPSEDTYGVSWFPLQCT